MSIDGIGLAAPTTLGTGRSLDLDHHMSGGRRRPGQADAVAAAALDRDQCAWSRAMRGHPVQQHREPLAGVIDSYGRDRHPGGSRDLRVVGVAVGVDTDTASTMSATVGTSSSSFHDTGHCRHRPGWSHRAAHL
jgi:hypothetical protein